MKKILFLLVFITTNVTIFSQETGTVTDPRDGRTYKTIKIGNQWVMAENLAYKPIKGVYWGDTIYGVKYLYLKIEYSIIIIDSTLLKKYGYFYDFKTANSIAIPGWHLPTKDEWKALLKSLGGNAKKNYSALIEGSSSGFNAVLGGMGIILGDSETRSWTVIGKGTNMGWTMKGEEALFWSSSNFGLSRYLLDFVPPATKFNSGAVRVGLNANVGLGANVRLFKDN